jgi:acetyl esterase/lipase
VPLVVFNINYRHTPEHRYPTGWNDVEDAFVWVHENIVEIAGLGDQIAVGGISAGAQLAASLTLTQLHGENKRLAACPKIQGQVLMIPWLVQMDSYAPRQEMLRSPELSSLVQCASAPILPTSRIQLFSSLLGVDGLDYAANYRRLNPGNTTAEEVKDLPPTAFGVAGNDPLRDEGLFYAKLLSENGSVGSGL